LSRSQHPVNRLPVATARHRPGVAELIAAQYATLEEREKAVVAAALADLDAVRKSYSPMVGWTAQLLNRAG